MDFLLRALDYIEQGGWVMIPLGVTSLVLWTLIIDRLLAFRARTVRDISIREAVASIQNGDKPIKAVGLRAHLVKDFLRSRSGTLSVDRDILRECAMRQREGLTRYLSQIAVLASAAPLMGLLGTVLGMIQTFNVIAAFGTGNAKALASGISVALITTQAGLLIAIPGLFFSGMLFRRSRTLNTQLDEVVTILDRNLMMREKAAAEAEAERVGVAGAVEGGAELPVEDDAHVIARAPRRSAPRPAHLAGALGAHLETAVAAGSARNGDQ
jgi:biopolymer transport protein ExbB